MGDNMPGHWSESDRALLAGLLDEIIPASPDGSIPSAGALGIADFVFDRLAEHPEQQMIRGGLERAGALAAEAGGAFAGLDSHTRTGIVSRLEGREPAFFALLIRHTYMGYYSRSDIRPLFGLSDQPTQPLGYDVPSEPPEFMAELTEPVRKRGPVYRDC